MKLNQNQKKLYESYKAILEHVYTDKIAMDAHLTMLVMMADKVYTEEPKNIVEKIPDEDISEVYKAYPTRCVVRGAITGKTRSNRNKIRTLLKSNTKEELLLIIEKYVSDCKKDNVYMKNFTTFLNQLPDYDLDTLKKQSTDTNTTQNKEPQWQ